MHPAQFLDGDVDVFPGTRQVAYVLENVDFQVAARPCHVIALFFFFRYEQKLCAGATSASRRHTG